MGIDQENAQRKLDAAIRDMRTKLGYSQESFAAEVGVHRPYMGAIERGERNVSLMNILRIANSLGLKPSKLFSVAKL